jgi:hypothetical protein
MGKTPKRLALTRETVRDLSSPELGRAAGGRINTLYADCINLNHTLIPSCDCTGYYPSLNAPCTNGAQ